MKTGVVTFHSAHNYGATLQAWALQKALAKLGATPCIVNYHPQVIDRLYTVPRLNTWAKRTQYLKKKEVRKRRRKLKTKYTKYQKFLREHFVFAGDYTTYEELAANPPGLDCYIAGSDQVWNPDHTGGYDPAYLLEFAPEGSRRISYAASIGRERFPAQYRQNFGEALKKFDAVSVREDSAVGAVAEVTGQEPEVVLDPTLLLLQEEYEEIKVPAKRAERYILVYMMETNRRLIQLADNISIATGLPVIQRKPGKIFRNELESFYTHTPGEFLGEVEKAEYVITNSFHGTVFSIIYGRPFLSMLHSRTGSRTVDLLRVLGLENHILYEARDFKDMKQFRIENPKELERRVEELRAHSLRFLLGALGKEEA
ncbi:MAG: polysaccharide pyruvyl transferase family protein [Lachnospiraceae bacterium]|nr:polysaccharide pyruvyl transferase family protein [Lachnospiraceae bacterium]